MPRQPRHTLAPRIFARIDALAACTSVPGQTIRPYLSKAHRTAADLVMSWMHDAGMTVALDATGAVNGRLAGTSKAAKTLLIGSHLDTMREAGRFDGSLGIVLSLEVLTELRRLGVRLPYAVEIVAYGNDAGMRYPAITNANASAAQGDPFLALLEAADENAITLREALVAFGCDPAGDAQTAREAKDLIGYVEVQPDHSGVLEREDVPVGVVTTFHGVSRFNVAVDGSPIAAVGQPAQGRKDVLVGVAEMILALERIAKAYPAVTATVGRIQLHPGVASMPPLEVHMTIDVRSAVDRTRRRAALDIDREIRAIARRRQVAISATETINQQAVACDPRFISRFNAPAETLGHLTMGLPSGLRHDVLPIPSQCPAGMLLVRSRWPGAVVGAQDIEIVARHFMQVLETLSPNGRNLT